jgi:hypothetical protein
MTPIDRKMGRAGVVFIVYACAACARAFQPQNAVITPSGLHHALARFPSPGASSRRVCRWFVSGALYPSYTCLWLVNLCESLPNQCANVDVH